MTPEKPGLDAAATPALRSLAGLIAFDAAAGSGSFTRAAEDLSRTPAAISQQIRQLERNLGFALFTRHPRHVELTHKGREFSEVVSRVLRELRTRAASLRDGDEENVLRVSATHSFALKWLVPRLGRFTQRHPELDLRIDATDRAVNVDDPGVDVALRYGPLIDGDPALLFRERLVAVCSPALLPSQRTALKVSDLPGLPLLYESSTDAWHRFLAAHRAPVDRHHFARGFSHWGLLAQAAVAGQGVALVAYAIVHDDLERGALRRVAARSLSSDSGYRFLSSASKSTLDKVRLLRAWLDEEMRAMDRALDDSALTLRGRHVVAQ